VAVSFAYYDSRWQFLVFFFVQYVPQTLTLLSFCFYIIPYLSFIFITFSSWVPDAMVECFGCRWICVGHLPEHLPALPVLNCAIQWHTLVQFSHYFYNFFLSTSPPVTKTVELKPQCLLVVQSGSSTDVLYASVSCAEHNSYLMTCLDLVQDMCRL